MRHTKVTKRAMWRVGLLTAMSIAGSLAFPQIAGATPNPPGNNGTVKIDKEPFDNHPNNEPHVGCTFQVDFYGYDEGDLHASVTFEAKPPTPKPGDDQVILTDQNIFIGQDSNAGGGSEAGLDASRTYTLDLSGITPKAKGVHVKLTVHAEGSRRGADTKHKVFWVQNCQSGGTTSTTHNGGGGGGAGGKGAQAALPFTGSKAVPLAVTGLLLLFVGAGGVVASRRLRITR